MGRLGGGGQDWGGGEKGGAEMCAMVAVRNATSALGGTREGCHAQPSRLAVRGGAGEAQRGGSARRRLSAPPSPFGARRPPCGPPPAQGTKAGGGDTAQRARYQQHRVALLCEEMKSLELLLSRHWQQKNPGTGRKSEQAQATMQRPSRVLSVACPRRVRDVSAARVRIRTTSLRTYRSALCTGTDAVSQFLSVHVIILSTSEAIWASSPKNRYLYPTSIMSRTPGLARFKA